MENSRKDKIRSKVFFKREADNQEILLLKTNKLRKFLEGTPSTKNSCYKNLIVLFI